MAGQLIKFSSGGGSCEEDRTLCWNAIKRLVKLLFGMPDAEAEKYINDHANELTKAEKTFLNMADDPKFLWVLLERVIGTDNINPKTVSHDEILKRILEEKNAKIAKLNAANDRQEVEIK